MTLDISKLRTATRFTVRTKHLGLIAGTSLRAKDTSPLVTYANSDKDPREFAKRLIRLSAHKISNKDDITRDSFKEFPMLAEEEIDQLSHEELVEFARQFVTRSTGWLVERDSTAIKRLEEGELEGLQDAFKQYEEGLREKLKRLFPYSSATESLLRDAQRREAEFSSISNSLQNLIDDVSLSGDEIPQTDYMELQVPELPPIEPQPIKETNRHLEKLIVLHQRSTYNLKKMNEAQISESEFNRKYAKRTFWIAVLTLTAAIIVPIIIATFF